MLETGDIGAGDAVEVVSRPDHGVTVGRAFRIVTTEQSPAAPSSPRHCEYLPVKDQPKLAAKIDARAGARA